MACSPSPRRSAAADGFAVARIDEALTLREAGCRARIVLLEGMRDAEELEAAARHGFEPFVHQDWQVALLESFRGPQILRVWLKIDTGMHRLGFAPGEAASVAARLAACRAAQPAGFATHLADAEHADGEETRRQLEAFAAATAGLPGERSIANSAGLIAWPAARGDWVRPGIMLYGISPFADRTGDELGLLPAMSFETRDHRAQGTLPPASAWVTAAPGLRPCDARIAVAAVGYGDGYPRSRGQRHARHRRRCRRRASPGDPRWTC